MLSTALVLATSMVVGQPDAAAATIPNPIVKELQFFVGEWTSEGTVQGTPIRGALTLKWSPGQYCLVGDHRVQLGGEEIRGSAVWGWDSGTEELLWTAFYSNNVLEVNRQKVASPGVYRGEFSGAAMGQPYSGPSTTEQKGPNEWTFTTNGLVSGGEKRGDFAVRFTRKTEATTDSTENAAASEAGPDYEQLKQIEWLIGDWEGDVVVPPGFLEIYPEAVTVHSKQSYFWMENKNYIGFKFRDEKEGKLLHQGFEMIGVDPQSKKLMHWIFSIAGGYGTGEWSKEGDAWELKWSGFLPNKAKYEGTSYLERIDANTHTWQMRDIKRNGEKVSDYPVVTFRRSGS